MTHKDIVYQIKHDLTVLNQRKITVDLLSVNVALTNVKLCPIVLPRLYQPYTIICLNFYELLVNVNRRHLLTVTKCLFSY